MLAQFWRKFGAVKKDETPIFIAFYFISAVVFLYQKYIYLCIWIKHYNYGTEKSNQEKNGKGSNAC